MSHSVDVEKDLTYANLGGAAISRNITPGGHPLDASQPAFPVYHRKFANPAPLGLSAFALTTFVLSMANIGVAGVNIPSIVIGLAFFYGGLVQLLAGMWEFAVGNTFGATAFSSYGAFWLAFGYTISPWSGVLAGYGDNVPELLHALGFFLFGWFIFTFIMFIASLRSSIALSSVFGLATLTFLLLALAHFFSNPNIGVAGGYLGLFTAFNAWYVALAGLLTPETSYFTIPVGPLNKRD